MRYHKYTYILPQWQNIIIYFPKTFNLHLSLQSVGSPESWVASSTGARTPQPYIARYINQVYKMDGWMELGSVIENSFICCLKSKHYFQKITVIKSSRWFQSLQPLRVSKFFPIMVLASCMAVFTVNERWPTSRFTQSVEIQRTDKVPAPWFL